MPAVLVVDDSAVDRRLMGRRLEAGGYEVRYACDGEEAWKVIQQDPPHLVLTDLIMPRMDGLKLVRRVVKQFPLTPVVLVTGKGSEETAVQAIQEGAASYVPKGMLDRLLLETVEKVLSVASQKRRHAELMDHATDLHCRFVLGNQPELVAPLVNYLSDCARALGLKDQGAGVRLAVALEEALTNALIHGNLEIDSAAREEGHETYRRLVEQRMRQPPYCNRRIEVYAEMTRESAQFVVRDEGPGFNPGKLPNPTEPGNLEKASGRGLLLMQTFMDEVRFNPTGNEVIMIKWFEGE